MVRLGAASLTYGGYGGSPAPSLQIGSTKRPMELDKQVAKWLQDDSKWGGHETANELRYMGVFSDLTEVMPVSNSTALGIVTLRFGSPSAQPVAEQILVRLKIVEEDMHVEWTAHLGAGNGAGHGGEPTRRLYRRGKTLLLLTGGRLCPFESDNLSRWLSPIAAVPGGESAYAGFADQRYIILNRTVEAGGIALEAFDLERLASFPVLNLTLAPDGADTYLKCVPAEGAYLLLEKRDKSENVEETFTIHLPDGRRARMPQSVAQTWRDYAIGDVSDPSAANTLDIFSARTGKRVARLRVPR